MIAVAVWGSEVSFWKSVVETVCQSCHHSWEKWRQSRMICLAISHYHPQKHTGESTPGIWHQNRKAARPVLLVQICVSRLL